MRSASGGASPWRRSDPGGSGELSRVSTASSAPEGSVSGGGGRGLSFLDAFRSCFVPPEARSPETSMSDDFHPSHQRTYTQTPFSVPIFPTAFVLSVPGALFSIRDDIFSSGKLVLFVLVSGYYCAIILGSIDRGDHLCG
jgi:hypothetical protein